MARLDVSELMGDPDFADPAKLYRYLADVDPSTGRTVTGTECCPEDILVIACSVSPVTAQRLSQGTATTGYRAFHTASRPSAGDRADGTEADVVEWNGNRWQVVEVNDWSTFGRGFVEAICTLVKLR